MTQSYGSPAGDRQEDLLGRWSFAREIYEIANREPEDWPLRIGIYGRWGSGKTSILKFVEQIAREDRQIVVWFNPWKYTEIPVMWKEFVLTLHRQLSDYGLALRSRRLKTELKGLFSKAAQFAKEITRINFVTGQLTEAGCSIIGEFIKFNAADLRKLRAAIGNLKIYVLVDDLDRTNPRLVPELLYTAKELLDLPGFVFVMSFDPEAIAQALQEFHCGWGDGVRLLEKIIDFPKWIPAPSAAARRALIDADVARFCPFVNRRALERIFPFLPDNLRTLRMFIRQIASMEGVLNRFDETEIDWEILLLAHLIKLVHPDLCKALFERGPVIEQIFTGRIEDKGRAEFESLLKPVFQQLKVEVSSEVVEMVRAISERVSVAMGRETLRLNGLLGELPSVVTNKEYRTFLLELERSFGPDTVIAWIKGFAAFNHYSTATVMKLVFQKTVKWREFMLQLAADAITGEQLLGYLQEAQKMLHILEWMAFELDGPGVGAVLGLEDWTRVFAMVLRWVHFDNSAEYRLAREQEKRLLERWIDRDCPDPKGMLELLQPWTLPRPETETQSPRVRLVRELVRRLEPKVIEEFLKRFESDNGLNVKDFFQNQLDVYLLGEASGCFWKEPYLSRMRDMVGRAPEKVVIQSNLAELVQIIHECLTKRGKAFLAQEALVDAIWTGAVVKPFNPRFISTFKRIHADLERFTGRAFKTPNWWSTRPDPIAPEAANDGLAKHCALSSRHSLPVSGAE